MEGQGSLWIIKCRNGCGSSNRLGLFPHPLLSVTHTEEKSVSGEECLWNPFPPKIADSRNRYLLGGPACPATTDIRRSRALPSTLLPLLLDIARSLSRSPPTQITNIPLQQPTTAPLCAARNSPNRRDDFGEALFHLIAINK